MIGLKCLLADSQSGQANVTGTESAQGNNNANTASNELDSAPTVTQ